MTQSEHPARRSARQGPKGRGDSTHPARSRSHSRSRTRRGGDRRPYPTAATTTRISPAKPGSTTTRSRSRGSVDTPTPATVWTAGPTSIPLNATWPTPIVSKVVDAFSKPKARVVLLPWPTRQPTPDERPRRGGVGAPAALNHAPRINADSGNHTASRTDNDTAVTDTRAAVESIGRSSRVVRIAAEPNLTGSSSRPFWADLIGDPVGDPRHAPMTASASSSPPFPPGVEGVVLDDPDAVLADTDLIITSLRPEHSNDTGAHASDLVALVAARLLRPGGVLAVLTHCDWPLGELIDPTGAVVASAQNADLLYLQHIVALHVPVRDGQFVLERPTESRTESVPEFGGFDAGTDGGVTETERWARHRAAVRGLPAPHRRIHSDVLVFAQPHEYEPLPESGAVSPAGQAFTTGVIR